MLKAVVDLVGGVRVSVIARPVYDLPDDGAGRKFSLGGEPVRLVGVEAHKEEKDGADEEHDGSNRKQGRALDPGCQLNFQSVISGRRGP